MPLSNAKYIITKDDRIIIFPASIEHIRMEIFSPKSAGFISFGIDENGNATCSCYGESVGLGLKSNSLDTILAQQQITITPL